MRRGAMPVIIEHGRNGFLADDEEEFARYLQRVDEIEPQECRRSVQDRFSAAAMAERYVQRYEEVIARAGANGSRNGHRRPVAVPTSGVSAS
jgi:glycosyltransferase involved in cell wall biosynthesis